MSLGNTITRVRHCKRDICDDRQVTRDPARDPGAAPRPPTAPPAEQRAGDRPSETQRHRVAASSTLVIEGDVIPRRLRRPSDAFRLVIVLVATAALLGVAYFASSAASGLDQDVFEASNRIPLLLVTISNFISAVGVIAFPAASTIDLLIRRQPRQLFEALCVLIIAFVVIAFTALVLQNYGGAQLLTALTGRPTATPVSPLSAILGATISFICVARLMDRSRWAVAATAIVVGIVVANIVGGGITVSAIVISMLVGWAFGLSARFVLGTPTTRPPGLAVASALESAGFPLAVLRASHEIASGRRYSATTRSGARMDVLVMDRDLEGAGIARAIWRNLRLRDQARPMGFSMRHRLEHAALQSYAAEAAAAPVPRLLAVCEVGPDAALLAYARVEGKTFAEIADSLTDTDLAGAWRALRTLHDAQISHRTLGADSILRDTEGGVWLLRAEPGSIASTETARRVDCAELLCTLALLTTPQRAVDTGREVLGGERLGQTLALLQPLALTAETRSAIRSRKPVLVELQRLLEAMVPEGQVEQVDIKRVRFTTIFMIIAGTVAAYLLLAELGQISIVQLFSQANWLWAAVAAFLSVITYVGATWTVDGFVPERLSFRRTFQTQWAASFATLVSPPTLGSVAVNVRYLQRCGLHPALAAASIGVSQIFAFVSHLILLVVFAWIAGTSQDVALGPPRWAWIVIVVLVFVVVGVAALPASRRWAARRILPVFRQVGPRLATLLQDPRKIATGVTGILILNLGYCACLVACVWAFQGTAPWAAIAVVYLAGAAIGQAAPTPGGIGAVEAALAGGLAVAGLDGGIALSATLLFRLFTFLLPVIPGWFAFHRLQRDGYL